mmetsp:Transcript_6320/g.9460  ORF Transcript_6320/g.9460 Transcript_6320/m.9460 type:complete len:98 (+) Transcript_6320:643-936(+)
MSPSGPRHLSSMWGCKRNIQRAHNHALKNSGHQDFENPFAALADLFVELEEDIEIIQANACKLVDMMVIISVGEMILSTNDIFNARGQIVLILSIYE